MRCEGETRRQETGNGGERFLCPVERKLENPSAFLRLHGEPAAVSPNLPVECRGPLHSFSVGATVSECVGREKKRIKVKISISSSRRIACDDLHNIVTV